MMESQENLTGILDDVRTREIDILRSLWENLLLHENINVIEVSGERTIIMIVSLSWGIIFGGKTSRDLPSLCLLFCWKRYGSKTRPWHSISWFLLFISSISKGFKEKLRDQVSFPLPYFPPKTARDYSLVLRGREVEGMVWRRQGLDETLLCLAWEENYSCAIGLFFVSRLFLFPDDLSHPFSIVVSGVREK